jgi:adenosylcobinamide amidohydrolase
VSRLFAIACRPPWLLARFRTPQRIVSWSLNRPGFVVAGAVAWLQVKDADLPIGLDPKSFLESRLVDEGLGDAVGLMTARDIRAYEVASAARTAALLADDGRAIGTGTDCIAIACPAGETRETFAGLHTAIGTNIASAVFRAARAGRRAWEREQAAP